MNTNGRGDGLTVLLTVATRESRLRELMRIAPGARFRVCRDPAKLERFIAEADIVAGAVTREAFPRATRLKWLHSWAAGPNWQLFPEIVASEVVLTCNKGNGAVPLAEHAIMLMLMLARNAPRWIEQQRQHHWESFTVSELNGLTCGIIGTGHSGSDLALKAKAFHMRPIGLRRRPLPAPNFDRLYSRDELGDFLAESDFVVVTAPLTRETEGMLGEAEFRAMKRSAFYVCCSRGRIADDAALCRALQEGWIAGAGLDAHAEEPLPPDSPFWDLPNFIITAHAGAATEATVERGHHYFAENLGRFVRGEPLINVVDKEAGY